MVTRSDYKNQKRSDVTSRPGLSTILARSLRLRCPRCGGGKLFHGLLRMASNCPDCKLKYERGPGYFLGSTYINYGLTSVLMAVFYVSLVFGAELSNRDVVVPLLAFVVLFPLAIFRHARSLWLGMDCFFDRTGFDPGEE